MFLFCLRLWEKRDFLRGQKAKGRDDDKKVSFVFSHRLGKQLLRYTRFVRLCLGLSELIDLRHKHCLPKPRKRTHEKRFFFLSLSLVSFRRARTNTPLTYEVTNRFSILFFDPPSNYTSFGPKRFASFRYVRRWL